MTNTIGYVTTERTQISAAINTDLDLTSYGGDQFQERLFATEPDGVL